MPATSFPAGQWHDYFMTVGSGAAALTGLVFVAMTLHRGRGHSVPKASGSPLEMLTIEFYSARLEASPALSLNRSVLSFSSPALPGVCTWSRWE
jgi:hypothetical protein